MIPDGFNSLWLISVAVGGILALAVLGLVVYIAMRAAMRHHDRRRNSAHREAHTTDTQSSEME